VTQPQLSPGDLIIQMELVQLWGLGHSGQKNWVAQQAMELIQLTFPRCQIGCDGSLNYHIYLTQN
jgi:hypothetical protein